MNVGYAREFMQTHQNQIFDLFLTYQMIEMTLFLKLHLPELSQKKDIDEALEDVNSGLNSKTFGKLRKKYLELYPSDEYSLKSDLEVVGQQRNSFVHSLWMIIATSAEKEKIIAVGEVVLKDFWRQASNLLEKIDKLPSR